MANTYLVAIRVDKIKFLDDDINKIFFLKNPIKHKFNEEYDEERDCMHLLYDYVTWTELNKIYWCCIHS